MGVRMPRSLAPLVVVLLAGAMFLSPSPVGAQPAPIKTSIAAFSGTFVSYVVYVADALGLFAKHGLDVSLVYGTGTQVTTDVVSGSADFGTFAVEHALQLAEKDQDIKVVALLENSVPYSIIVRTAIPTPNAGKWPDAMRDLKGLKIGISTRGAGTDNMIRYLFKQAGMDPDKDVTLLPVGDPASTIAALNAGQIDGAMAFEPTQIIGNSFLKITKPVLDLEGGHGPKNLSPYAFEAFAVRQSFIDKNPDTVKRAVAAIVEAEKIIADPKNLDEITAVAAKFMKGIDSATLRTYLQKYSSTYTQPLASRQAVANVNEALLGVGLIKAAVPYEAVIDTQFLPKGR